MISTIPTSKMRPTPYHPNRKGHHWHRNALERTRNEVSEGFTTTGERFKVLRVFTVQNLRFESSDLSDWPGRKRRKMTWSPASIAPALVQCELAQKGSSHTH